MFLYIIIGLLVGLIVYFASKKPIPALVAAVLVFLVLYFSELGAKVTAIIPPSIVDLFPTGTASGPKDGSPCVNSEGVVGVLKTTKILGRTKQRCFTPHVSPS